MKTVADQKIGMSRAAQSYNLFMDDRSGSTLKNWSIAAAFFGYALLLLMGLTGCGSPVSDKPISGEARASAGKPDDRAAAQPAAQNAGKNGASPASATSPITPAMRDDVDDQQPLPSGIPVSVAHDLGSPDARVRYRALDHWEQKGSIAPLDAVFEAMEDEDEAVQARATAIVEQRWAAEQEKDQG